MLTDGLRTFGDGTTVNDDVADDTIANLARATETNYVEARGNQTIDQEPLPCYGVLNEAPSKIAPYTDDQDAEQPTTVRKPQASIITDGRRTTVFKTNREGRPSIHWTGSTEGLFNSRSHKYSIRIRKDTISTKEEAAHHDHSKVFFWRPLDVLRSDEPVDSTNEFVKILVERRGSTKSAAVKFSRRRQRREIFFYVIIMALAAVSGLWQIIPLGASYSKFPGSETPSINFLRWLVIYRLLWELITAGAILLALKASTDVRFPFLLLLSIGSTAVMLDSYLMWMFNSQRHNETSSILEAYYQVTIHFTFCLASMTSVNKDWSQIISTAAVFCSSEWIIATTMLYFYISLFLCEARDSRFKIGDSIMSVQAATT
ncbi:hypothetical protein HDU76_004038 [Blyttiomyces sp. JEL0837]|nr:hypothetical protein HDU76_004038 [Blyttiomyces sp. JEL0837]